jgi:uncharacterized protein DUF6235
MATRLRLGSGLDVLGNWADSASQADKNVIYKALFAVVDGGVFPAYDIFGVAGTSQEFFVSVKEDLVVLVRLLGSGFFGIGYIGALDGGTAAGRFREDHDEL